MEATVEFGLNFEDFKRLKREGKIKFATAIRIYNYASDAGDEDYYVVGKHGLYNVRKETKVNPKDVLSAKAAPNGWSLDGEHFGYLPDSEIKEYFEKEEKAKCRAKQKSSLV